MVVSFNKSRLIRFSEKASPYYVAKLAHYDIFSEALFVQYETWASWDLLLSALNMLSHFQGLTLWKDKDYIMWNSVGWSGTILRSFAQGSLKADCTFKLKLSTVMKDKYLSPNQTSKTKNFQYRHIWDQPVIIVSVCAKHGGCCHLGHENHVATQQRSGEHVCKMPINALCTLCSYMGKSGKIPSHLIKTVTSPVWPCVKPN